MQVQVQVHLDLHLVSGFDGDVDVSSTFVCDLDCTGAHGGTVNSTTVNEGTGTGEQRNRKQGTGNTEHDRVQLLLLVQGHLHPLP